MNNFTFGARLRSKRMERQLTQDAIAKQIGIKRSAVSQWEADETQPKGKNLTALCKILSCDAEWLQTGKKPKNEDIMSGLSADAVIAIKRIAELDKSNDDRVKSVRLLLGEPGFDL